MSSPGSIINSPPPDSAEHVGDRRDHTADKPNGHPGHTRAANGAILIPMHDAFAQIRTSTGLLEDLKAAYDDGSGIHHSLAGKQKMAELELVVLDTLTW